MDVNEKVMGIISEISDKTPATSSNTLQNDIGLDSLAMVMMLVAIEESFGIELKESDMNPFNFVTVQNVIDMVERYCGDNNE